MNFWEKITGSDMEKQAQAFDSDYSKEMKKITDKKK